MGTKAATAAAVAVLCAILTGCTPVTVAVAPPPKGLEKIDHFVFIMQENRSFDSYFGTYPGADGIPTGTALPNPATGVPVHSFHDTSDHNLGGPHNQGASLGDIDRGSMDGFLRQVYAWAKPPFVPATSPFMTATSAQDPRNVMGYHDWREIANYWSYADLYVLQDHLFQPIAAYSLPAHLYMLAARSSGLVNSIWQVAPVSYTFPEITELLQSRGIGWKYYVTTGSKPDAAGGKVLGSIARQADLPKRSTYSNPLPAFPVVRNDPAQWSRIVSTAEFYRDAAAGTLPQVSWIVPSSKLSEHPAAGVSEGMAYVTALVNSVMEGPDWDHTAIFISWDDWGGFYDHVVPPRIDALGDGIRVPGLVISPYAKQGFVDHSTYSVVSWLKLIEERYGIPPMTTRDRLAADMLPAFDFTQRPRAPVLLSATASGSPYPPRPQAIAH